MSNLSTVEATRALATADGITLLITIGNTFRSDDGVGPYIAQQARTLKPGYLLLNAGEKPENIIDRAVKLNPQKIIFIDAADFGGQAGALKIIPLQNIPETTLSTHTFPLPAVAKILAEDTRAEVIFLGIQPQSLDFGEKLSDPVLKAADTIIQLIRGD